MPLLSQTYEWQSKPTHRGIRGCCPNAQRQHPNKSPAFRAGSSHGATGFGAAFAGLSTVFAMRVRMLRALSRTQFAGVGAECANFFHAFAMASHRRYAQSAYVSTFQVQRNALGHSLHIGFLKARCCALQARNSTCIAGFNARFLNLIHHVMTPIKINPEIREPLLHNLFNLAAPQSQRIKNHRRLAQADCQTWQVLTNLRTLWAGAHDFTSKSFRHLQSRLASLGKKPVKSSNLFFLGADDVFGHHTHLWVFSVLQYCFSHRDR